MNALRCSACLPLAAVLLACGASSDRQGFDDPTAPSGSSSGSPAPGAGSPLGGGQTTPGTTDEPAVHAVYGHSPTTLYKLEPTTNAVTTIGNFNGCEDVIDIALDEQSTLYAVSKNTLYTVDAASAACTKVRSGNYPNSLSFVPKGTLDPNAEALVGYNDGDYVRIDVTTGTVSVIGQLGGNYVSSGDIVSVKGGKTFLTVKNGGFALGGDCTINDCLVEIDPSNGSMVKNWGSVGHNNVFGLTFWGGNVYGFDDSGEVFEVTFGPDKITTSSIPIPQKPSGLSFWGAGSSTSAPLTMPK